VLKENALAGTKRLVPGRNSAYCFQFGSVSAARQTGSPEDIVTDIRNGIRMIRPTTDACPSCCSSFIPALYTQNTKKWEGIDPSQLASA